MRVEILCYVQRRALVFSGAAGAGSAVEESTEARYPPICCHIRRNMDEEIYHCRYLTLLVAVFNVNHSSIDTTFESIDLVLWSCLLTGWLCTYCLAPFFWCFQTTISCCNDDSLEQWSRNHNTLSLVPSTIGCRLFISLILKYENVRFCKYADLPSVY
jgi:hypothetical protein